MWMTDRHILIAVNNCGSSHGWVLLKDTCGGRMMTETRHAPVRAVEPEWRSSRRIIGMQRNPFAWYVTGWWKDHYLQKQRGAKAVPFDEWFADLNRRPWRYLPVAYRPPPAKHILPGAYTFFHLHYCLWNSLAVFSEYRTMSQVVANYDANLGIDDWVFAHTYYEDFARILGRPVVIDRSRTLSDMNAHPHGPHQDYYTPEMRAYVQKKDGWLLDRYGYTWDGPAYRSAEHEWPECPSAVAVEKGSQ